MIAREQMETRTRELVKLEGLSKSFRTQKGLLHAFRDVNLTVQNGVSVGIVGESGSGKSTLVRAMQLLIRPTTGKVWMNGRDITNMSDRRLKEFRRNLQFVMQDPYGSLFPNLTISQNIVEPMRVHGVGGKSRVQRAVELMQLVGLPLDYFHSFPHELSGGQQQRVAIARALALEPSVLVLDEAVSSLDVSIQAQILNLLQRLKRELGLTYIFISHNLAVIRLMCEEIVVMYLGRVVEQGPSNQLFQRPLHPYTRSLVASIPAFTAEGVTPLPTDEILLGEKPSPTNIPSGCPYHTRCPIAIDRCKTEVPELREIEPGRVASCHLA